MKVINLINLTFPPGPSIEAKTGKNVAYFLIRIVERMIRSPRK